MCQNPSPSTSYLIYNQSDGFGAHVAEATDSSSGEENDKKGSEPLTSVNMSVALSLKLCQQADHTDKPEHSWERNLTNKAADRQPGPAYQTCLTLSASVKSAPWHWLEEVYQTKQAPRFTTCALNLCFSLYWIIQVRPSYICALKRLSWFFCWPLSFSFFFPGSQLKYCAVVQRHSIYQ